MGDAPTIEQLWGIAAPMLGFLGVVAVVLLALSLLKSL